MDRRSLLPLVLFLLFAVGAPMASYVVTNINTTVVLNLNTSAKVTEAFNISISNDSVSQYAADRLALNFTLSQWQNLIGRNLVEHIINPTGNIYHFTFLPGPLVNTDNGKRAVILLSYYVTNVTSVNQTGPRTFQYRFNSAVLNFQHAESGVVLGGNTSLTMVIPRNARIDTVFPPPDAPLAGFANYYRGVTSVSWMEDEPLSKFSFVFTVQGSLQDEVLNFFTQTYDYFGGFIILIVGLAIVVFIVYTYLKVGGE